MAAQGCASFLLLRLRRAWRRSAARRCPRLPAENPVLRALCTDGSVYERVCSAARAAKGDSLYDLLAAGRAAALLPPGQRLFASGNAFLDDIRCYCQRSNSRHRTPRSPCAHPPAAIALTCTITHSAGLSRTIAAPTVGL